MQRRKVTASSAIVVSPWLADARPASRRTSITQPGRRCKAGRRCSARRLQLVAPTTTVVIEDVTIDDLRPDPANPRRIGEDELDALERSLRQFGFVQPVLARREDRTVIGGHQRLTAARR